MFFSRFEGTRGEKTTNISHLSRRSKRSCKSEKSAKSTKASLHLPLDLSKVSRYLRARNHKVPHVKVMKSQNEFMKSSLTQNTNKILERFLPWLV